MMYTTGVPPAFLRILISVSCVVTITRLLRDQTGIGTVSPDKKFQASVTIFYFTVLFLVCNLPAFINGLMFVISVKIYKNLI